MIFWSIKQLLCGRKMQMLTNQRASASPDLAQHHQFGYAVAVCMPPEWVVNSGYRQSPRKCRVGFWMTCNAHLKKFCMVLLSHHNLFIQLWLMMKLYHYFINVTITFNSKIMHRLCAAEGGLWGPANHPFNVARFGSVLCAIIYWI